jgi:hypothetical protein
MSLITCNKNSLYNASQSYLWTKLTVPIDILQSAAI